MLVVQRDTADTYLGRKPLMGPIKRTAKRRVLVMSEGITCFHAPLL